MTRNWKDNIRDMPGLAATKHAGEVAADIYNSKDAPMDPEDVAFIPTREQRKLKAMCYALAKSKRVDVTKGIELETAMDLVPSCRVLRTWWHNDLFVEWFQNANTYQQRIDYLIDLQLDNLEDIITNRDGQFSTRDQVAAGKQLAEYKKAFIDEDKATRPDNGADMIKALAAKMLEAKKAAAIAAPESESEERKVELPI